MEGNVGRTGFGRASGHAHGCPSLSPSGAPASYALSGCEADLYFTGSAAVDVPRIHAFMVERGLAKAPPVVFGDSPSALQAAAVGESHRRRTLGICGSSTVGNTVMCRCWTITIDESTKC